MSTTLTIEWPIINDRMSLGDLKAEGYGRAREMMSHCGIWPITPARWEVVHGMEPSLILEMEVRNEHGFSGKFSC